MRRFRSFSHFSTRYVLYSLTVLAVLGQFSTQAFGFNPDKYKSFKVGAVYARAIVKGPNDQPIYVVYGEDGKEVRKIGEASGQYEGSSIMSGDTYRSYIQQLETLRGLHGQNSELVSRDNYLGGTFQYSTGQTIQQNLNVGVDTKLILIRPEEQRTIGMPEPLILAEFPVDLQANPSLNETVPSILVSKDGVILEQAQEGENIGFRTGFFFDEENRSIDAEVDRLQRTFGRRFNDKIYGPVSGVPVYLSTVFRGGFSVTDERGVYSFQFYMPPCPGFAFEYTTDVWAELYYLNFNPRGSPVLTTFYRKQDWTWCIDYASSPFLSPLERINVIAIESTIATPLYYIDFPLEVAALTGYARLTNKLPVGIHGLVPGVSFAEDTSFQVEPPDTTPTVQSNYDFDGDDNPDSAVLGRIEQQTNSDGETQDVFVPDTEGELQGVYLSSIPHEVGDLPHLTRLPDTAPDFRHQGLLEQVSEADLQKTDLYVFRKSNGQLVIEREGLDQDELPLTAQTGVDNSNEALFYKLLIRGPGDYARLSSSSRGPYTEWESTSILDESLHERESDNLRPGEELQIIMINRATGYIGTTTATMQSAGSNGAPGIGVYVDPINMRPPNLKIHARRTYDVKAGSTAGEERTLQIGFEGSALTDDRYVEIITEWYDHDGSPLPEALGDFGYTGRLAQIVAENELGTAGSSLSQFSIRPGTHLQVLKLQGLDLGKEHFYIHVNGERKDGGNPDFGSTGQNEGILRYRPDQYVPFLVQVYNEELSIDSQNAYRIAKQQNPDLDLKKPEGVYSWVYRPEYQFSVFLLEIDKILLRVSTEEGIEEINIIDLQEPIVGFESLLVSYGLSPNNNPILDPFGVTRELVLALGENEAGQPLPLNGNVSNFTGSFEHGSTDLTGRQLTLSDLLTIRLYQNTDVANVLWEFAGVPLIDIDVDSDNTTVTGYPKDEKGDRSSQEDKLENNQGKLVKAGDDIDNDRLPDFVDGMDNDFEGVGSQSGVQAGYFEPIVLELADSEDRDAEKVKFIYPASDPAQVSREGSADSGYIYTAAPGDLRLWTKDNAQKRKVADLKDGGDFINADQYYTLDELGFDSDRKATLYIEVMPESASDLKITAVYSDSGGENLSQDAVSLYKPNLNSMDRYFAGSIDESFINYDNFGIRFENLSTGETYEYSKLSFELPDSGGGGLDLSSKAFVYQNKDDILSDAEISALNLREQGEDDPLISQNVVFYRENGKLHFNTVFNDLGTVRVTYLIAGEEIGNEDYTLTRDFDVAELLDTIDATLSNELVTDGSVPFPSGTREFPDVRPEIKNRNLTAKAAISIWDQLKDKFKRGVAVAREAVKLVTIGGQGFVQGFWTGVKDDATAIAELARMVASPIQTAQSIAEGFKALKDLTFEQLKRIPELLVQQFLSSAEENIAWAEPNDRDIAIYIGTFTSGYLTEQILVGVLTGGAARVVGGANIGSKIANMLKKIKGGERILNATLTIGQKLQKVRAASIRRLSSLVETRAGMQRIKARVDNTLFSGCLLPPN